MSDWKRERDAIVNQHSFQTCPWIERSKAFESNARNSILTWEEVSRSGCAENLVSIFFNKGICYKCHCCNSFNVSIGDRRRPLARKWKIKFSLLKGSIPRTPYDKARANESVNANNGLRRRSFIWYNGKVFHFASFWAILLWNDSEAFEVETEWFPRNLQHSTVIHYLNAFFRPSFTNLLKSLAPSPARFRSALASILNPFRWFSAETSCPTLDRSDKQVFLDSSSLMCCRFQAAVR